MANVGFIGTFSGELFNVLEPRIGDFKIVDQAHTLSQICRYGGQPRHFYSVAMHEILMTLILKDRLYNKDLQRWALIHDNGEAYYGDIIRPLKKLQQFKFLGDLEAKYEALIGEWLGLPFRSMPEVIDQLDRFEICGYEAPRIFDKLHPDWILPSSKATSAQKRTIRIWLDYLLEKTSAEIEGIYLEHFEDLFGHGHF